MQTHFFCSWKSHPAPDPDREHGLSSCQPPSRGRLRATPAPGSPALPLPGACATPDRGRGRRPSSGVRARPQVRWRAPSGASRCASPLPWSSAPFLVRSRPSLPLVRRAPRMGRASGPPRAGRLGSQRRPMQLGPAGNGPATGEGPAHPASLARDGRCPRGRPVRDQEEPHSRGAPPARRSPVRYGSFASPSATSSQSWSTTCAMTPSASGRR